MRKSPTGSREGVIERLEEWNVRSARRWMGHHRSRVPADRSTELAIAGGFALFCGVGSPLTHAIGLGRGGPVSDRDLGTLESFYRERNTPFEVDLSPLSDSTLPERLRQRGYALDATEVVLTRPNHLPECKGLSPGIGKIVRLEREDTDRFSQVLARAAFSPAPPSGVLLEVGRTSVAIPGVVAWVVTDGDEDIACGAHSSEGDFASLFGGATDPEHRGQGIQRALIEARLAAIAETDAVLVVVVTREETTSLRNAVRCGFAPLYSRTVWTRGIGPAT